MAHFALIKDNIVELVIPVSNNDLKDSEGNEQEHLGIEFIHSMLGPDGTWLQTSYNNNIRKNYASVGFAYDSSRDAFIAPKPYASWVLNETTCRWEPPTPHPDDKNYYYEWDESTTSWSQLELPELPE